MYNHFNVNRMIAYFIFTLTDAGRVFVCGKNDCGQIGLRNVTSQGHLYPCPITNERIVKINCGESHSAFITGKFTFMSSQK